MSRADRGQRDDRRAPARTAAPANTLAVNRAEALRLTPVSRETAARLDRFIALLIDWQSRTNLVAASTLPALWTRHVADSLQLIAFAPEARTWVDLGAGAGFPGLPIACALADIPGAMVHMVESNAKKAAFLREAVRITGAPAQVHPVRIGDFVDNFRESVDIVTARALAPLERLLAEAYPLLQRGSLGIFPKGQDVASELTETTKCWTLDSSLVPSRTDPRARIVVVRALERRSR